MNQDFDNWHEYVLLVVLSYVTLMAVCASVGYTQDAVFADGFESGDARWWDETVQPDECITIGAIIEEVFNDDGPLYQIGYYDDAGTPRMAMLDTITAHPPFVGTRTAVTNPLLSWGRQPILVEVDNQTVCNSEVTQ
jgi:hypothetical protein